MVNSLKKYLSTNLGSLMFFLLAIAAKVGIFRSILEVGNDLLLMMVTTRNWLAGHGLSIKSTLANDLAQSAYIPFTGWPPGIHLQIAPFLWIFGEHYVTAVFFLLIGLTILFFWILRNLLLLIGFPIWLTNLFLVFQSLVLGRYMDIDNPSDYAGMIHLLAGLYFICKGLFSEKPTRWNILAILFLTLAGLTRYQYSPIVIVIGLSVILLGFVNRKRKWINIGVLITGSCLSILLLVLGLFLSQHSSGEFYLAPVKKGFYPSNLLHTYPFMFSPFLNLEFYSVQLSKATGLSYGIVIMIFSKLNYLLLTFFLGYFFYYIVRTKLKISSAWEAFFVVGGFITVGSIALVMLLSLVLGTQLEPLLGKWTFVMEARYFAFPILFIQLVVWRLLFVPSLVSVRRILRFLRAFVILFFVVETAHGGYVLLKKMRELTPLEDLPFKEKEIAFVKEYILKHQQIHPEEQIVFTGINRLICYAANWYEEPALYDALSLNKGNPTASKKTIIILGIRKQHKVFLREFLMRSDIQLIHSVDQFEFYKYEAGPN